MQKRLTAREWTLESVSVSKARGCLCNKTCLNSTARRSLHAACTSWSLVNCLNKHVVETPCNILQFKRERKRWMCPNKMPTRKHCLQIHLLSFCCDKNTLNAMQSRNFTCLRNKVICVVMEHLKHNVPLDSTLELDNVTMNLLGSLHGTFVWVSSVSGGVPII